MLVQHIRLLYKCLQRFYFSFVSSIASRTYVPIRSHGFVKINDSTYVGTNVCSNGLVIYGKGTVKLGAYTHTGKNIKIYTENHDYLNSSHIPYAPSRFILKSVNIGDFCWIGDSVTILPGAVLGEGCIVQAGSVVVGSYPPLSVLGGAPARVFSHRDATQYYLLKNTHSFH